MTTVMNPEMDHVRVGLIEYVLIRVALRATNAATLSFCLTLCRQSTVRTSCCGGFNYGNEVPAAQRKFLPLPYLDVTDAVAGLRNTV